MPFKALCCCPYHVEWGFGPVDSSKVVLKRADYSHKIFCGLNDSRDVPRKRKICLACDNKIALLQKSEKLSKSSAAVPEHSDEPNISVPLVPELVVSNYEVSEPVIPENVGLPPDDNNDFSTLHTTEFCSVSTTDKNVQTTLGEWPKLAYQDLTTQRAKKHKQNLITELVCDIAKKTAHGDELESSRLVDDVMKSQKWSKLCEESTVQPPV